MLEVDDNHPFLIGLCKYTTNSYDHCEDKWNKVTCLFCDHRKFNVAIGKLSKPFYLYIGCNQFRTSEIQNESLAQAYKEERGLTDSHTDGILYEFISKINDEFQESIEKLAVQSKNKIVSVTAQFETISFDCQASASTILPMKVELQKPNIFFIHCHLLSIATNCYRSRRSQLNNENPLTTVLNIFREALDRKDRNNSVTVFGIPGDLPTSEIDQMFDRICKALGIHYKINVNLEKIKNMLIYKFCCRRHRDHFFYNFQEFKLTGSSIGLVSNTNLYCFENMASKMYNLSREIHDRHQRREIKKYLRHQGLIYVWTNGSNVKYPKLFYFMEELNVRKENIIRLLNTKILFSKIVQNTFPEKIDSIVNMRHSRYIKNYLFAEECVKYHPVSSIVDFLDQEDFVKKDRIEIF